MFGLLWRSLRSLLTTVRAGQPLVLLFLLLLLFLILLVVTSTTCRGFLLLFLR
jgi:hypothetical protein